MLLIFLNVTPHFVLQNFKQFTEKWLRSHYAHLQVDDVRYYLVSSSLRFQNQKTGAQRYEFLYLFSRNVIVICVHIGGLQNIVGRC